MTDAVGSAERRGFAQGPVRWGFLGAGFIAQRALAPAVHVADGAELAAVAARDVGRAAGFGPTGRAYGAYEALLEDPDVEAVYISLTNEAHHPLTLRALAAGKHVLCEKPLALDAGQVREMSAAAEESDRLLVEATWSRWHPRTRRAEAMLAAGTLGAVRSVDAGFTFSGVPEGNYRLDPERGGGSLYDVGPYAVGAALWAVPDGDVEVQEAEAVRHPSGVDLTTQARIRVGDADAVIRTSIDEGQGQWIRIVGERGTMVLDPPAHTSWLAPSTLTLHEADGELVLNFGPVDAYRSMVEHVSRAIRGDGNAWLFPLADSLRVAEALDAIRSAAS